MLFSSNAAPGLLLMTSCVIKAVLTTDAHTSDSAIPYHLLLSMSGESFIYFDLFAGQRLFNQEMNQGEVVSMLLGYTPLPYEANPALFQSISAPPNAQSMLRQMLQRNPTARPALKDVSPFTLLLLLAHAACTGVVF